RDAVLLADLRCALHADVACDDNVGPGAWKLVESGRERVLDGVLPGLDRGPRGGELTPWPGVGFIRPLEARLVDRRRSCKPSAPAGQPVAGVLASKDGVRGNAGEPPLHRNLPRPVQPSPRALIATARGRGCRTNPPSLRGGSVVTARRAVRGWSGRPRSFRPGDRVHSPRQ